MLTAVVIMQILSCDTVNKPEEPLIRQFPIVLPSLETLEPSCKTDTVKILSDSLSLKS